MNDQKVLLFPQNGDFYRRRAQKAIEAQDFVSALRHLHRAREEEPDNVETILDLADLYARMGLYERSNLELQLIFHRPDLPPDILYAMGANYLAMGDYDQAEIMLRAYTMADDDGEFMQQANDSLVFISQCEYDTPEDRELDILSMDGKAALDAGDYDHAIDCLTHVLERDPGMNFDRNNLAVAYYCVGDMENAWAHVNIVLRETPLDVSGRCNASMFCLYEGKQEEAKAHLSALRLNLIEELDDLYKYCLALADLNMDEELKLALSKILLLCPYDPSMLWLLGVNQYRFGEYAAAIRTFELLLLTEPGHILAADAMKLAKAAENQANADTPGDFVTAGVTPAKTMSYSFDFSREQDKRVERTLETLRKSSIEEIRDALKDRETYYLVRAALYGDDRLLGATVMLLGYAGGKEAERLLRELLLSPTHNSMIKRAVLETLQDLGADEPYYCLNDGKLTQMQAKRIEMTDKLPPESYLQLLHDACEYMAVHHPDNSENAIEQITGLWVAYMLSLHGHYPRITRPEAWIAAMEGLYLEDKGIAPDWHALAKECGATTRMLDIRRNKLLDGLEKTKAEQAEKGDI